MRRWNGWGDDTYDYPLPEGAQAFLDEKVGRGAAPADAALDDVLRKIPPSRLPDHPLLAKDPETRLRHARGQSLPDWIALRGGQIGAFPDAVAFPSKDDDVRDLLAWAGQRGARVVPYGGGTSVVGHINVASGDVPVLTIDLSRLNRLRHFDETSQLATFGAGVAGPDLEAQLRARGYTLGHFPQSFEYSTLGGWIATRSSGQQSLGYGRIESLFAGGRVEAPAGTLNLPANIPASAAGPDAREWILGSEGRLGIITEATVRVTHLPKQEDFHAYFFPTFEQGQAATRRLVQMGVPLSMLRLSTAIETETTLALAGHERLIGALETVLNLRGVGERKAMLLVGLTAQRRRLVRSARGLVDEAAGDFDGIGVGKTFGKQWHKGRFRTPYLRNQLWTLGYAIDTLETATSWSEIPGLIAAIEAALKSALPADERLHVFTHLSHFYPYGASIYTTYLYQLVVDPAENLARWQALKSAASAAIVARGGTISHQHGVGTDHRPYLAAEKGDLGLAGIASLARQFDPDGMMNPGKLIE